MKTKATEWVAKPQEWNERKGRQLFSYKYAGLCFWKMLKGRTISARDSFLKGKGKRAEE
jgi:hypothetical protein